MHLCNITTVCLWYCSECARNYEYQTMVKLIIYTVHTSKCSSQHALPWYPTVGPFLWARAHHSFRLFLGHWEADERSIWRVDCGFSTFRNKTHVIFCFSFRSLSGHKPQKNTANNQKPQENATKSYPCALPPKNTWKCRFSRSGSRLNAQLWRHGSEWPITDLQFPA